MSRFVVVGNANCRRVALFQSALVRVGYPEARLILWSDLLDGRSTLREHLRSGDIVRFESMGRDFGVEQQLLARGAIEAEQEVFRFLSATALKNQGEEKSVVR
ncbi:MAG: hypothetical protein EOP06_19580, partial [Proteobacteria bacterium]